MDAEVDTEDGGPASSTAASPARFPVLACYCASSFLLAGAWNTLSPIFDVAAARFHVSSSAVAAVALSLNLTYLPGSLLALYTTERLGLRFTLLLGSALQLLMCSLKWAGVALAPSPHAAYGLLLCGQLIGGLGQPLVLNTVARLTQDWFPPNERDVATTIGFQASNAGAILFNSLPAWVVRTPADLRLLFLAQLLAWPFVILAMALCMATDTPAMPPSSATAAQWLRRQQQHKALPPGTSPGAAAVAALVADLKLLCAHRNFVLLTLSFSCTAGVAWALSTVEGPLIESCGYSPRVAGGAGALSLTGGLLSCIALAPWLRASWEGREYLPLQRRLQLLCAATTAVLMSNNRPLAQRQLLLSWALCGAAQGPLGPLTLEHAAAMTYPLAADSSSAALFMASNLASFIQTELLQALLRSPASALCLSTLTPGAVLVTANVLLGCLFVWAMTPQTCAASAHVVQEQPLQRVGPAASDDDAPLLTQAHLRSSQPAEKMRL